MAPIQNSVKLRECMENTWHSPCHAVKKREGEREIYHDHGCVLLLVPLMSTIMEFKNDWCHMKVTWQNTDLQSGVQGWSLLIPNAVVSSLAIPRTWGCSNHVWTESFFLPLLPLIGTKQVRTHVYGELSEGPWHAQGLCHSSGPGICRTQQTARASWSWPDLQLSYYRSTRIKYQTFLSPLNKTGIIPTSQDCHAY